MPVIDEPLTHDQILYAAVLIVVVHVVGFLLRVLYVLLFKR